MENSLKEVNTRMLKMVDNSSNLPIFLKENKFSLMDIDFRCSNVMNLLKNGFQNDDFCLNHL
jgi:hypothetical protein